MLPPGSFCTYFVGALRGGEEIAAVENAIAKQVVGDAVEIVAAGARARDHHAAAGMSVLRRERRGQHRNS